MGQSLGACAEAKTGDDGSTVYIDHRVSSTGYAYSVYAERHVSGQGRMPLERLADLALDAATACLDAAEDKARAHRARHQAAARQHAGRSTAGCTEAGRVVEEPRKKRRPSNTSLEGTASTTSAASTAPSTAASPAPTAEDLPVLEPVPDDEDGLGPVMVQHTSLRSQRSAMIEEDMLPPLPAPSAAPPAEESDEEVCVVHLGTTGSANDRAEVERLGSIMGRRPSVAASNLGRTNECQVEHLESMMGRRASVAASDLDVIRLSSLASTSAQSTAEDYSVTRRRSAHCATDGVDRSRWSLKEFKCNSKLRSKLKLEWESHERGSIAEGRAKLLQNPEIYEGLWYHLDMLQRKEGRQRYRLLVRGTAPFEISEDEQGPCVFVKSIYRALEQEVELEPDAQSQLFQDKAVSTFVCPGRGFGVADVPSVQLVEDVRACDVFQGRAADSWFLGGLSALAEYPAAVWRLLRNTTELEQRPLNSFNQYTVTLYDLPCWTPVDVVVDERLYCSSQGGLQGCGPSARGALWCPYVEKAAVAHCGGWEKLQDGTPCHAWALLTGSKAQFMFRAETGSRGFRCYSLWDSTSKSFKQMTNSPKDCKSLMFASNWPQVGGKGAADHQASQEEMFERMFAWRRHNYLLVGTAGGATGGSSLRSITLTILEFRRNVASTGKDMVKVRNPWGKGELEDCRWSCNSPNLDATPGLKEELHISEEEDGSFWMDKDEFFEYFHTFFLCAMDVVQFANLADIRFMRPEKKAELDAHRMPSKAGSEKKKAIWGKLFG